MSKKYTIVELVEFINRFSIEQTISWKINHLYKDKINFEVYWIYDKTTLNNWYVKKSDSDDWLNMIGPNLIKYLVEQKADLGKFELQLLKDICIQAVCSHYFVLRASDLIGEDKVNASIDVMLDLMKQKKIEKENTVKLPKLKLVKTPIAKKAPTKKTKKEDKK